MSRANTLAKLLGSNAKPIPLGPELVSAYSEPAKRLAFLKQWQQAVAVKH